jgi:hypothetical protein
MGSLVLIQPWWGLEEEEEEEEGEARERKKKEKRLLGSV